MNIDTTFTQESQSCPGVKFTLRVLNQYQRGLRDAKIIDARVRVSDLAAKLMALPNPDEETQEIQTRAKKEERELAAEEADRVKQLAADPHLAQARIERATLDHRMALIIDTELKPAYIRASLLSVEGLELGGTMPEAPWDLLIQSAPDALLDELYVAAQANSGLTETQSKN